MPTISERKRGIARIEVWMPQALFEEFTQHLRDFDMRHHDEIEMVARFEHMGTTNDEAAAVFEKISPPLPITKVKRAPLAPSKVREIAARLIPQLIEVLARNTPEVEYKNDQILILDMLGESMCRLAASESKRLEQMGRN